jgi:NADH-quinone oxidoreductase subunit K
MMNFDALLLSILVFLIGMLGVIVNRKNLITTLISIEIMLLASNINFIAFSALRGIEGYLFSIFIITIAAAEAAIGLAIIITYFRNANNIEISEINRLKE